MSQPLRPISARGRRVPNAVAPTAQKTRSYYETLSLSSAGLELGLSVVIGALFGRFIDGRAGTEPVFMVVLLLVGFAAGIRGVIHAAQKHVRLQQEERELDRDADGPPPASNGGP